MKGKAKQKAHFWFKFEWDDWLNDRDLGRCSLETQGFWIRSLCLMYEAGTYFLEGRASALASLIGCDIRKFNKCIDELLLENAAEITKSQGNVNILSRRLFKAANLREYNKLMKRKERERKNVKPRSNDSSKIKSLRVLEFKEESTNVDSKEREKSPPAKKPSANDFGKPQGKPIKLSLTNHPAIVALRTVTEENPPKAIWELLANKLGTDVDIGRLTMVYAEWLSGGRNPTNWEGITDWYLGKRKFGATNGTNRNSNSNDRAQRAIDKHNHIERIRESLDD